MLEHCDYINKENGYYNYKKDKKECSKIINNIRKFCETQDEKLINKIFNGIVLLRNLFYKEAILEYFYLEFTNTELGKVSYFLIEGLSTRNGEVNDHKKYVTFATGLQLLPSSKRITNRIIKYIQEKK